jgi:hypothetical protein
MLTDPRPKMNKKMNTAQFPQIIKNIIAGPRPKIIRKEMNLAQNL